MANDTEVAPQNKPAFEALMAALGDAQADNSPTIFSKFDVEDKDSEKAVQVALKIHVPQAARIRTRDFVADYLEKRLDAGETFALFVTTGTKTKPDKEQLDVVLRYGNPDKQTKPQVIRLEIKPPGGGSGGGAKATTIQEVAQCVYASIRYKKGKDLECHTTNAENCITLPDIEDALKNVNQGNDNVTAQDIDGMTAEWKETLILGANKIAKGVGGSNWKWLRGGGLDHSKNGAIAKAYDRVKKASTSKDNVPGNEDKWNPADIWMVQNGMEDDLKKLLDIEGTIDCLNNFLDLAFSKERVNTKSEKVVPNRSLVGISLKKLGTTANFKIMNEPDVAYMKKAENIVFNKNATLSELTSFSAMDVYLCYGPGRFNSFQARNFGGTSSGQWQLELKGQFAAQGKIKGEVMRKLMEKVDNANPFKSLPPNEVDFNDCKINSSKINTVVDDLYKLMKEYVKTGKGFSKVKKDENKMKSSIMQKDASWRFSKINGLKFLEWLDSLPTADANRAMKEMYLYASSQNEKSSVHYKLF
tara:strand:- start:44 stop:1633 length:1590 start_codon:yes stop_codon:yes gene_type:complete